MPCCGTQAAGQTVCTKIGQTTCAWFASSCIVWRTSGFLSLTAQRTAEPNHSNCTSCSTIVMLQTLCLCVNQMHVGSKCWLFEFTKLNLFNNGCLLGHTVTVAPRTSDISINWCRAWWHCCWQRSATQYCSTDRLQKQGLTVSSINCKVFCSFDACWMLPQRKVPWHSVIQKLQSLN